MKKSSSLFAWEHEPVQERPVRRDAPSASAGPASNHPRQHHITQKLAPRYRRDPPNPLAEKLSTFASDWSMELSPSLRPEALCDQFPRIANRLALCWFDAALAVQFLDALLLDKRGGRDGFPPAVATELMGLRAQAIRRAEPHMRLHQ